MKGVYLQTGGFFALQGAAGVHLGVVSRFQGTMPAGNHCDIVNEVREEAGSACERPICSMKEVTVQRASENVGQRDLVKNFWSGIGCEPL